MPWTERGMYMKNTIVYDNIYKAIEALEPAHVILQNEGMPGGLIRHQNFTLLDMGDGTVGAFPLEMSMRYYRGENDVYEHCYSNLYRIADEADRIIWQIKTEDFVLLLKRHEEIQRKIAQKEYVEFTALAQHYEFPTNMLDVTNDLLVAAYFATHVTSPVTGEWEIRAEGLGRIRWSIEHVTPVGRLVPIGMQAFARPGAQSAFGIYLEEGEDYAAESGSVLFRQDAAANQSFHQTILGGPQLFFPEEGISGLAKNIKQAACVTAEAVEAFCRNTGHDRADIGELLRKKGIAIVDAPVADWCMLRGQSNAQPSFARVPQLRPMMTIG